MLKEKSYLGGRTAPDSQAMNLQGIWNGKYAAEWDCNYTINVNTQMNYRIAETAQLSEYHIARG